jgi:hypothetical protein
MSCATCLVCLVSTVSVCCKKHSDKQALESGTKRSRQAERGQSGLPNIFVFVLCPLLAPLLKWMFHKLKCVVQSTFLRYSMRLHHCAWIKQVVQGRFRLQISMTHFRLGCCVFIKKQRLLYSSKWTGLMQNQKFKCTLRMG